MINVDASTTLRDVLKQAATNTSKAPSDKKAEASAKPEPARPRAERDTVSLSDGAEKMVNLNRGQELGNNLKNAPVDENFAENLRQASQDVFRITKLFNETMRALFARWR